jgi:hypothetical protein
LTPLLFLTSSSHIPHRSQRQCLPYNTHHVNYPDDYAYMITRTSYSTRMLHALRPSHPHLLLRLFIILRLTDPRSTHLPSSQPGFCPVISRITVERIHLDDSRTGVFESRIFYLHTPHWRPEILRQIQVYITVSTVSVYNTPSYRTLSLGLGPPFMRSSSSRPFLCGSWSHRSPLTYVFISQQPICVDENTYAWIIIPHYHVLYWSSCLFSRLWII